MAKPRVCAHCGKEYVSPDRRRVRKFCTHTCYAIARRQPIGDRFWARTDKGGAGGCWIWTGTHIKSGYGTLSVNGVPAYAHRLSLELHGTTVPQGALVLHACDNPPCVNPAHLFLGTDADNIADKVGKGRHIHADTHPNAKLRSDDVREIRELLSTGMSQTAIGVRYGVHQSVISFIKSGRLWKSVA